MKNLKKTIALVCTLVLLLALVPAASADSGLLVPDREYLNPENECVAAIYDAAGFFTEEEKDRLLEQMQGCTDWFDIFIVTDDRPADEITEDPEFLNICSAYHLALIFGSERKDMRVQWAFYPGEDEEDELLAADEVAAMFSRAKKGYLNGGSAFDAANGFAENLLTALQENGAAPVRVQQENNYYSFKTLEEFLEILAMDTEDDSYVTGTVDRDYTLEEDIIIPAGKKVFFGEGTVTVAPGVTVTVEEDAGLFFYGLDVQGTVVNNGDLVQCEALKSNDQLPIRIEGKIINNDWFSFYEIAEGMERIENANDGRLYSSRDGETVLTADPSPMPAKKPSGSAEKEKNSDLFDSVLVYVFCGVMIFLSILAKKPRGKKKQARNETRTGKTEAFPRQKKTKSPAAGESRMNKGKQRSLSGRTKSGYGEEKEAIHCTHSRGKEKYYEQLDSFLKNGFIDKKEYQQLKSRYSELNIDDDYH